MNYLLQRKKIPTRYFKISSAAEFNKIVKKKKKKEKETLSSHFTAAVCELNL